MEQKEPEDRIYKVWMINTIFTAAGAILGLAAILIALLALLK